MASMFLADADADAEDSGEAARGRRTHEGGAIVIIGISASPTACPLRRYGRAGTQK